MMSGLVLVCDPTQLLCVSAIQMQDENHRVTDSLCYIFQSLVRVIQIAFGPIKFYVYRQPT
jgi:hypothetical protein